MPAGPASGAGRHSVGFCQSEAVEARPCRWRDGRPTDLGGRGSRSAVGINNRSQVIGEHYIGDTIRAFLWQRGRQTDLGTLGGADAVAADLNERGQVVGWASPGWSFRWRAGVRTEFAGSVGDLNEKGWIGGTEAGRSFLLRDGRRIVGDPATAVMRLNERGRLVGWWDGPGGHHATLWK